MATIEAVVRALRARERRSASALIAAERSTLNELTQVVDSVSDRVLMAIANASTDDQKLHVAPRAIHHAIPALTANLTSAIVAARVRARDAGRTILAIDLGEDRVGALPLPASAEDYASASASAAAFAAAWGGAALMGLRKWKRRPELSIAAQVKRVAPATESRLRRITAFETAHAFSGEQIETASRVANLEEARAAAQTKRQKKSAPAGESVARIIKVWSAILDVKTCSDCASMNGRVVLASDVFEGGDPPMHPFCRCVPVFVTTHFPLSAFPRDILAEAA